LLRTRCADGTSHPQVFGMMNFMADSRAARFRSL
jgi:hypothetical protein